MSDTNSNVMDFESLGGSVTPTSGKAFGSAGKNRLTADFFALATSLLFLRAGRFLTEVFQGKTLAEWIVTGKTLRPKAISIRGRLFPIRDGFALSLETLKDVWGCPGCASCHGAGKDFAPSKGEIDAYTLARDNEWYYNPATREFFTISKSCWKQYVENAAKTGNNKYGAPGSGEYHVKGTHYADRFRDLLAVKPTELEAAIALYKHVGGQSYPAVTDVPKAPETPATPSPVTAPKIGGKGSK